MESMTRLRIMRLLTEAKDRVSTTTYELPRILEARATTIENKLLDLIEDIRDLQTD